MDFTLTSLSHGNIELFPVVPPSLKEHFLNAPGGRLFSAETVFWQAMLQKIPLLDHHIYYGVAFPFEEVVLRTFSPQPILMLRLVLNGNIIIDSDQAERTEIPARHFVAAHYPDFLTSVTLAKGIMHEILEIHCSLQQVREMIPYFDELIPCYEAMLEKKVVQLSPGPVRLPAEALILLRFIKRKYRKNEKVRPFYYDNHALALLALLLDLLLRKSDRPSPYTLHHLEKVLLAERIIEKEYMTDLTLNSVAGRVQMETYALKEGFHKILDTNFSQCLLERRMQRAAELLEERQKTIEEIGRLCGYSSAGGFRNAFLSFYGYMPRDYWKKK